MIIVVVFIAQISNVTSVFDAAQPELLRCWGVNATGANLKVAQGHCGPGPGTIGAPSYRAGLLIRGQGALFGSWTAIIWH